MKKKNFSDYFASAKEYIVANKIKSIVGFLVIVGLLYWAYSARASSSANVQYTFGTVKKDTIVASISGTGQVSTSNQVDLNPKVSGDVVHVGVSSGQRVSAGTLIAMIDSTDAQKSVRDAEINLESANLSYQKLLKPADNLSLIQAENALSQATTNLQKSYDDGFNSVSDTYLDLPNTMGGLEDLLYDTNVNRSQDNISAYTDMVKNYDENIYKFRDDAVAKYKKARASYDANFLDYRSTSRSSSNDDIQSLVKETYSTTRDVSDAVKSMSDFLNFVQDTLTKQNQPIPNILTTHKNTLNNYTSSVNSHLSSLLSAVNNMDSSQYAFKEKTESLSELKAGADVLDVKSSELTLKQRQNALADAKENLSNYYIRAPFSGVVAKVDAQKGESVGSGTSVATLITDQKIAEISLNEVDVSKVKVGQKATLTFDAVPDLTISGKVAEVDTIGTVSQGVVTYTVKIIFDTQDDRIKSGMSVSSSIITDVKQDILVVPNSAIKTSESVSYVERLSGFASSSQSVTTQIKPEQVQVEIGISNDSYTEIIYGLSEGESIIIKTINNGAKTTTTSSAPSLFGGTGNKSSSNATFRAISR